MSWIMGWRILSNARNIKTVKKIIRTLSLQNVLQEKQIQDLAHYLNLTATHVQLQGKMLNEIQTRLWEVLMWVDSEAAAWVSGAAETVDYFG